MSNLLQENPALDLEASKPVQAYSELEELVSLCGLQVDGEVTRHIIALLMNGAKPMNIFVMLQNLAKKIEDKETRREKITQAKDIRDSLNWTDGEGSATLRSKAKEIKTWALTDKPIFHVNAPKKTVFNSNENSKERSDFD